MKGSGDPQINMDEDVIGKVNQDVMDWASEQIEEITMLRNRLIQGGLHLETLPMS